MKSKQQLLDELIEDHYKELVKSEFLLDFYEREMVEPKSVGKIQATEAIKTHKEFNERVGKTIRQYEEYKARVYQGS